MKPRNEVREKVIEQRVGNISMEDYMANLLDEIEKGKVERVKSREIIDGYRQLNSRHRNIINSQRLLISQ